MGVVGTGETVALWVVEMDRWDVSGELGPSPQSSYPVLCALYGEKLAGGCHVTWLVDHVRDHVIEEEDEDHFEQLAINDVK